MQSFALIRTRSSARGKAILKFAILAMFAVCGVTVYIWCNLRRAESPTISRVSPQAMNALPGAPVTRSLSSTESLSFTRSLLVQWTGQLASGSIALQKWVDLQSRGSLFVKHEGQSDRIAIHFLAPRQFDLIYQVQLEHDGDRLSIRSIETGSITNVDEMSARLGIDLLYQYYFFMNRDLQGEYAAVITSSGPQHFEKVKTAYLVRPYSDSKIIRSMHHLTQDLSLGVLHLEGQDEFEMKISAEPGSLAVKESYAFEQDLSLIQIAGFVPDFSRLSWTAQDLSHPMLAKAHIQTLEGVPEITILITSLKGGSLQAAQDRHTVYRQLVARMTVDPTGVRELARILPSIKDQASDMRLAIGALAAVPNEEAQAVLIQVFESPAYAGPIHQMVQTGWIATSAELPAGTQSMLIDLAQNPATSVSDRQGALYAIGAQAGKSTDPTQRSALTQALLTALQAATTDADRITALESIGNSGDPQFIAMIQPYLQDPNPDVRSTAYLALRLIPGDPVTAMIQSGQNDASAQVRNSALKAQSMRPPTST